MISEEERSTVCYDGHVGRCRDCHSLRACEFGSKWLSGLAGIPIVAASHI